MKQLKVIITAALMCGAIFTGCRKGESDLFNEIKMNTGVPSTPAVIDGTENGYINYHFSTTNSASTATSRLEWDKGYINAAEIIFDGNYHMDGGATSMLTRNTSVKVQAMFDATTLLGSVNTRPGYYTEPVFRVRAVGDSGDMALRIWGTYNYAGRAVPIEIMVPHEITMMAKWPEAKILDAKEMKHNAHLVLDLASLGRGVEEQLAEAIRNNLSAERLILSPNSHGQIYQMVLGNITASPLTVKFE